MSAPVSPSQPSTAELLAELRHHEAEYQELVHGPLCGQAADRIEAMKAALLEINSQAVCACIATENECFQMLQNCAEISGAALPQSTAEPVRRCKHDVSEDCPACAEETIAGLKARCVELEAKTALVTFNEACKRIEELEASLKSIRSNANCFDAKVAIATMPLIFDIATRAIRGVARSPTEHGQ